MTNLSVSWAKSMSNLEPYDGPPRNVQSIDEVEFGDTLRPKNYEIFGTHPGSKILILDVQILDSTGKEPYHGDILIEGERFTAVGNVPNKDELEQDPQVRTFYGKGRTLMSGMGDAHTHLSWNGGDLAQLGQLGVEEHTLLTAKSAQCYLDSGYTMCWGAASAKDRLDVVIPNAVNAGDIPGPRYLANAKEICRSKGDLVPGISAYADGPDEMRKVIRRHVDIGADQIKLSMSGEPIAEDRPVQECFFNDEETAACVDEAHKHDVIFHASYTDDKGMDMLEATKSKHTIVQALGFPFKILEDGENFGYPRSEAEEVGYKKELETAILALREMHRRGIVVLPGGDYGFAWTPHGTYARDLAYFTKLLGFTSHESIISATAGIAKLFMREHELGKIQPGYYADCIVVDGDPLSDIEILQDHSKLNIIMINGRVHKTGRKEYYLGQLLKKGVGSKRFLGIDSDVEVPEAKKIMQKDY